MATTPTLDRELEGLIEALDAQIPANPRSAKNQRAASRMARMLKQYFATLENALPESILAQLYYKYVIQEAKMAPGAWDGIHSTLDAILASFHDILAVDMAGQMADIYISGSAEMVTWGHTLRGIPIAYEGPPIAQAIDWAERYCAKLVTKMDEETKRRLAQLISDGITNKRGVPGLARDIRSDFANMSRYRSQLIARTETANALSEASLDNMKAMGIDGKEWITVGDDRVSDECLGNEAEGVIPVNQMFSGGVMAPPQHPDCRCALAPARLPK